MTRPPIHFLCDANASVGFGHLSRCLKLAAALRSSRTIRFAGRFSAEARARIAQLGFTIDHASSARGGLAVVDIMFDKEDMDYFDRPRLARIRKRFARVVVLCSAMTIPADLPVDVVIGHVLRRPRARARFRVLAGLDYAPVSGEIRRARKLRGAEPRQLRRIFVGFGASKGVRGLESVLDGLALGKFSGRVDVLLSPFHGRFARALGRRIVPYRLRLHSNVPSVAPLMRRADAAFGTYGNIAFEAMCLGVPFLAVGIKDFQTAYARRLAARGLLVNLGRDATLDPARVAARLRALTREKRQSLSRRGSRAVDGRGIERIGKVIEREALRAQSA